MTKLGLIAAGGGLPVEIAEHCSGSGRELFVVRLRGFAGPGLKDYDGADIGIAELGKCIVVLKRAGCQAVCLAGAVKRPDFAELVPDVRSLALLPKAIVAAGKGDDALLRLMIREFEAEGFVVEGAQEVMRSLTLPVGLLGRIQPAEDDLADARQALNAARNIGRQDIGQAAVVSQGVLLESEDQEGTDALLTRIAKLPGRQTGQGVLAKAPKPIQDIRVDLPTIGLNTVRAVADAGLAGLVGEAGRLLVVDRAAVAALADELGVFILGVESGWP